MCSTHKEAMQLRQVRDLHKLSAPKDLRKAQGVAPPTSQPIDWNSTLCCGGDNRSTTKHLFARYMIYERTYPAAHSNSHLNHVH